MSVQFPGMNKIPVGGKKGWLLSSGKASKSRQSGKILSKDFKFQKTKKI
jgi:hypothetical protein